MKNVRFCLLLLFIVMHAAMHAQDSPKEKNVVKVLAIGNSFSKDAIELYLADLVRAGGKKIVIGNVVIGGASLKLHVKNAREGKAAYSYRKIDEKGYKTTTPKTSLEDAISDEDWDFISLQQVSVFSGKLDVITEDLPELIKYVRSLASSQTKLIYHQTWAYQSDLDNAAFKRYNRAQKTMYKAIARTTRKLSRNKEFAFIVPSGTAIQNARTSSIGDHFTRDGSHLQEHYGRFTAACTWFEMLFNTDVRDNRYMPEITALQNKIAKEAAHRAVKRPFRVSKLKF